MAKLTPDQLSMWHLMTSEPSPNATSSPGSAGGDTPSGSQGGLTTGPSGPEAPPASRSRSRAKAPVLTIQGTSGPTSTASSPPVGPLSSWESKLRARLGTDGSMEFELIWKELATPGGRSIFRLSRSTPRTFASDSIGSHATWRSPNTRDGMQTGYSNMEKLKNRWDRGKQVQLCDQVKMAMSATWPTPTKADGDGGHGMGTASATGRREDGSKITVSLPGVVKIVSTWPTPNTLDSMGERSKEAWERARKKAGCSNLKDYVPHLHSGTTISGSPDQTAKPGALNPAFACWLMGYPTAWDDCAPTATPSSRRSRQK